MRRALHRLLAGSAAALIAAAVVAAPAGAAHAADPGAGVHFPDLAVTPDGALGKISPLMAWLDLPETGGPRQVDRFKVTLDASGVSGIATVEVFEDLELSGEQSCDRAGAVTTCTLTGPFLLHPGLNLIPLLAARVTAKAGAATGATGELAFTAQPDDAAALSHRSTVEIGEGVDLAAVDGDVVTVAPGAVGAADLRVTNDGKRPVKGVVLALLGWSEDLVEGDGFRNCTYGLLTVCTFDDELAAGETYHLSTPFRLRIPADAAAGSAAEALGLWYTPSDFKELLDLLPGATDDPIGPAGKGGPVRLEAVPAATGGASAGRASAAQVDTNPDNNLVVSELVVAGKRRPDLAAIGATVSGAPGDEVEARVGFRNDGPGTLYHWSFDNTDGATLVTVPKGLTAVTVDDQCIPADGDIDDDMDRTGAPQYLCLPTADSTKAQGSALFDFTFKVRADPSGKPGSVRINVEDFLTGERIDRNRANDTAEISLAASGSGGGGGLPVTGTNAALAGAAGAVLLLAGGLGVVLARRRRVRFTA